MTLDRSLRTRWIILACHAAAACLLATGVWSADRGVDAIYFSSIPGAQVSLIAAWGAVGSTPAWLRLPAMLLGTAASTLAFLVVFSALTPDESAGWATALLTQALVVAIAAAAWRVMRALRAPRDRAQAEDSQPLRYSLRTLILWITALAVLLGVGREAFVRARWDSEVLLWRYFLFMPVLGTFHALYALIVLATLLGRDRWPLRMLLGLLAVGGIGASASAVLEALFGENGELSWPITLAWALGQAGVMYATLLPWGGADAAADARIISPRFPAPPGPARR